MPDQPRAKKSGPKKRSAKPGAGASRRSAQVSSGRQAKRSKRRRSLWARLRGWLSRLFRWRRKTAEPTQPANKAAAALSRLRRRKARTLAEWKELRHGTSTAVQAHLDAQEPIPAIKKLTLALLEDPQHEPYHELLRKAVEQRHVRRLKPGEPDPWASMPNDLRAETVKLEALSTYVDELESLLDQAGVPSLAAPPPSKKKEKLKK